MIISIASDHGGIKLKNEIIQHLISRNFEIYDLSPENDPEDDYPDFAYKVGKSLQSKETDLGILVCRSGIGISIAANKIKGVYCGRIVSFKDVILAREHNGVNCISLSGDDMSTQNALEIVDNFISSPELDDERHVRRFNKIIKIESDEYNEL